MPDSDNDATAAARAAIDNLLATGMKPEDIHAAVMERHRALEEVKIADVGSALTISPAALPRLRETLLDGGGNPNVEVPMLNAIAALKENDGSAFFLNLCIVFRNVLRAMPHLNPPAPPPNPPAPIPPPAKAEAPVEAPVEQEEK